MTGFITFFHAIICILLVVVILMQSGRGGGLTESFASAESMFGAQTSAFMIKATTILSLVFFVTCLGLAILSTSRDESLMSSKGLKEETVAEEIQGLSEEIKNAAEKAAAETEAIVDGAEEKTVIKVQEAVDQAETQAEPIAQ